MKKIKTTAETLKKAKHLCENEIKNSNCRFVLNKREQEPQNLKTQYYFGSSFDKAIKKAEREFKHKDLKEIIETETYKNTDKNVSEKIRAFTSEDAVRIAKVRLIDKYFSNIDYGERRFLFTINSVEKSKNGFNGILGMWKSKNTYDVNIYVNARVRIKYKTWAVVEADVTSDLQEVGECFLQSIKESNHVKTINLIKQGADVNYCDENGRNALYHLMLNLEFSSISEDNYKVMRYLLKKGINVNNEDNYGEDILLHYERDIWNGKISKKIVMHLIASGLKSKFNNPFMYTKAVDDEPRRWCNKCSRMVDTINMGKSFDDGWREDIDLRCPFCMNTLFQDHRQIPYGG